jgi:hypothetical protein
MTKAIKDHSNGEAAQRIKVILRGAFAGPPTPLKDIPTKEGESRASKRRKKPKKRSGKYA